MNQHTPWTTDEDVRLRDMANGGMSGGQIAAALERTRNSVIGRAHRLGILLGGTLGRRENKRVAKPKAKVSGKEIFKPKAIRVPAMDLMGDAFLVDASVPPVSLEGLNDGCCKWPVGEGMYCGSAAPTRKPYCGKHSRISARRISARRIA